MSCLYHQIGSTQAAMLNVDGINILRVIAETI